MEIHMSVRLPSPTALSVDRRRQLLDWLGENRDTIAEVAFFDGWVHTPVPMVEIKRRAALLAELLPQVRRMGLRAGINHLVTVGHLDEDLENALNEPWQRMVDFSGSVSASCYCASDPSVREYIRSTYQTLAEAKPDFIWIDDDVRMEWHPKGVTYGCFCNYCLAEFSSRTGQRWTRESLLAAFCGPDLQARLGIRRRWLEHLRACVGRIMQVARAGVDAADPRMVLGSMSCEHGYSGRGFADWIQIMAGPNHLGVKMRPGGGFYNEDRPLDLVQKMHSVGRQNSFIPTAVTDIQYEHENFPYQATKKSRIIFMTEIATAIAAGCTGAALNTFAGDPIDEYLPYYAALKSGLPYLKELVNTFQRTPCEGIWRALEQDHAAVAGAHEQWPGHCIGAADHVANELFEIGLPPAYSREGAKLVLLSGDDVYAWSPEQLRKMLSGPILLDGHALERLGELGLDELAGFTVNGHRDLDVLEVMSDDPLNGRFSGWHRDCRPSFWPQRTHLLRAIHPAARPISHCVNLAGQLQGICAGVFQNQLGGRVAVFGYFPWTALQCMAKVWQMRSVADWATANSLPGRLEGFHRAVLWCRRDPSGRAAFLVLNASIDPAIDLELLIYDSVRSYRAVRNDGRAHLLDRQKGKHGLKLPEIAPWGTLLVLAVDD